MWWGPLPGDGRLDVRTGGSVLGAPPQDVWTATTGAGLCTDGDPVRVTGVDAGTRGDVRRVDVQVLTMQPAQIRASGVGGYAYARGAPPDFDGPDGRGDPLPGRYEDAVGATVTEPCGPSAAPDATERQTLLVVVTVGPAGGAVTDLRVTHRSWGRDRTITSDDEGMVSLVVCGVRQTTRGCPSMRQ